MPVVLMRDLYRRSLMILGLGATVFQVPMSSVLASEVPSLHGSGIEQPNPSSSLSTDQPVADPAVSEAVTVEVTGITEATANPDGWVADAHGSDLPSETPTMDGEAPETSDRSDDPGAAEAMQPTLEPGEEAVPLETDGGSLPLADDAPSDADPAPSVLPQTEPSITEDVPNYLRANPNPLLLQTQPQEVEISGTQPIDLETALELAYRNSEELQIAILQVERTRAGLRAEQALLYPTADLNATLENSSNQNSFGGGGSSNTTRLQGGLRADYDLGLSGERAARIRAAEEQVRLAELQFEQVQAELRLNTITDYYAIQEAIEQIRINQAFLDEAERNLADTELREEVGVGTRFDVLRAGVQVANARQTLTQARSQRQIAQRQLARRLNIPPSIDLTTAETVAVAGSWPLSLEESIVLAYQNRAELEQFLVERDFNDAQREAALAQLRPGLGLFAQYSAQTFLTGPAQSTGSINDGYSIGAQLSWRLFDGGAARARAAQSDRDIQIDEFEFENARNTIRVQVEEAYYTLLANQANIDTANIAVEEAREALRLAGLRFEAGVGTQLDVLTATSELTQAEGNRLRAILDYNRALARLERAVSNLSAVR